MTFPKLLKLAALSVAAFACITTLSLQAQTTPSANEPSALVAPVAPVAPVAQVKPKVDTLHGDIRTDNYSWLRDKESPEVISHLTSENAYVEAVMAHTKPLQEKLFAELKGRIKETDISVPVKKDDWYYYSRDEEGKQYKIHARKRGSLTAEEQVVLDVNQLAEGQEYMSASYDMSPDHNIMAYTYDSTGSEVYVARFKDLSTGTLYSDMLTNLHSGIVWGMDNKTCFYLIADTTWRPYKLFRHTLGTSQDQDAEVYHEKDPMYWMSIERSRSDSFLILFSGSGNTHEIRYLDAYKPDGEFHVFAPRTEGIEYFVQHRGSDFYVLTNEDAMNFKVMKTPVNAPEKKNWQPVVPHDPNVMIDNYDLFANHLVLYTRRNGLQQIELMPFATGKTAAITFDEAAYTLSGGDNPDFNNPWLRFAYSSPITPNSVYDYNMNTAERELKKQREVLGGYDPTRYTLERVMVKANDGKQVPLTLMYLKGTKKDGSNPTLLYGYGSYGSSMDPWFSSNRLSLVDRGVIFALAHIRGGGDMGRIWKDDGKLRKKMNTFTDFIACGEYLVKEKWTNPGKLSCMGGSAGGLLIGATINLRPDLFNAAVAQVPFVDVVNTMLDESIPLTTNEFVEWGNPKVKDDYEYMKTYSPYDNVKAQNYPNILLTAGLNDPRVGYWEPAKFASKLRATKTDNNLLLFKIEMGAGHGGSSGRYDALKDIAFDYSFLLDRWGITN